MAVRLRLKRTGKKKQPSYRVVAVDGRKPRDGRVLEIIGTYDPRQEPSAISIRNERAVHWLSHGAQPSDTVSKLFKVSGAWDEFEAARKGGDAKAAGDGEASDEGDAAPKPAPVPDLVIDRDEPEEGGQAADAAESGEVAAVADEATEENEEKT